MATRYLYWQDGATSGAIVYDPRNARAGQLIVTDDGTNWSCVVRSIPGQIHPPTPTAKLFSVTLANARPAYRLSVKWAQGVTRTNYGLPPEWGKIHTTQAGKFVDTRVVPYTSPLTRHLGSVAYSGFETVKERSAHTLEAIHLAINASVARAIEVWGWQATGLEVCFHSAGRAYGLAYDPGTGKATGVRKISLNAQLLELYDLNSIARTVVHELCHHYREERWPRTRRAGFNAHDSIFCTEIAKADPEVISKESVRKGYEDTNTCIKFADMPDPALDAAMKAKVAARTIEAVWAPDAGTLEFYRLKSGMLRMCWEPRPGFRWTKRVEPISDRHVLELAKRFSPGDWHLVRVHLEPRYANYLGLKEYVPLDMLFSFLLGKFGRIMPKTTAYLAENGVGAA